MLIFFGIELNKVIRFLPQSKLWNPIPKAIVLSLNFIGLCSKYRTLPTVEKIIIQEKIKTYDISTNNDTAQIPWLTLSNLNRIPRVLGPKDRDERNELITIRCQTKAGLSDS